MEPVNQIDFNNLFENLSKSKNDFQKEFVIKIIQKSLLANNSFVIFYKEIENIFVTNRNDKIKNVIYKFTFSKDYEIAPLDLENLINFLSENNMNAEAEFYISNNIKCLNKIIIKNINFNKGNQTNV